MKNPITELIVKEWEEQFDKPTLKSIEEIQELWSGYGMIARVWAEAGDPIICKCIDLSCAGHHPRGWDGSRSHQRKVRSYEVEMHWYAHHQSDAIARWPKILGRTIEDNHRFLWMEDLDHVGYHHRRSHLDPDGMEGCLRWLAHFHASTFATPSDGLWPRGSYWHLETRPDELEVLEDVELAAAAPQLDRLLTDCPHRCIIHGDAKVANFCFKPSSLDVAAVDFQYVGGGIGIQDVAYFMGSCLDETSCEAMEAWVLERYFYHFKEGMAKHRPNTNVLEVEKTWRDLFDVSWTDFHRFIKGWSPGHWKINGYSEKIKRRCLQNLCP